MRKIFQLNTSLRQSGRNSDEEEDLSAAVASMMINRNEMIRQRCRTVSISHMLKHCRHHTVCLKRG